MNHLEHEDGSPRRVATTTVWEAVRTDIAAAFASVAGPLPAGEHSACGRFLNKSFLDALHGCIYFHQHTLFSHFSARKSKQTAGRHGNDVCDGTAHGQARSARSRRASRRRSTVGPTSAGLLATRLPARRGPCHQSAPSFVTFHVGIRHINGNGVRPSVIDSVALLRVCRPRRRGARQPTSACRRSA